MKLGKLGHSQACTTATRTIEVLAELKFMLLPSTGLYGARRTTKRCRNSNEKQLVPNSRWKVYRCEVGRKIARPALRATGDVATNNYGFAPAEGVGQERFQLQMYKELFKLLSVSGRLRRCKQPFS